jgi:DNA-binding HxlR family transcriptional regulator
MEELDEGVWTYIRNRRDFVRFGEAKKALGLSPQKLTRAIKRLEEGGYLFTDVRSYQHRPINTYLAIDPEDPSCRARIVDDNGWLILVLEWSDDEGHTKSVSMGYGEIADWLKSEKGKTVLSFAAWAEKLEKVGRLSFEESSWGRLP